MNLFTRFIVALYSKALELYPRRFRDEFAEEMQIVFSDSLNKAIYEGTIPFLIVCLKEFGGLPFHVLRELWYEVKRKDMIMVTQESVKPKKITSRVASHWNALIGTLPFVLFGLASIIGKFMRPFSGIYISLAFYAIVLLGLLIGLIKRAPRWTYSYLGWSLIFALHWSNMTTYGLKIFGFQINHWSWQMWPPFFVAIGIALLWTRSLHPLRQLILNIWHDWTLASFMMYVFFAHLAFIYDENHHPLLFLFMTLSIITMSIAAWIYLSSSDRKKSVMSLLSGFVLALGIDWICWSTWDWYAYTGYPRPAAVAWYVSVFRSSLIFLLWVLILFWPALLELVKRSIKKHEAA